MKRAAGVFFALCLTATAFAQTITRSFGSVVFPGGTSATTPGITRNFGSVVFPGGSPGTPPVRTAPTLVRPFTPAPAFHGGNSFNGVGNTFRRPGMNRGGRIAPVTVYAYPVYVGGYGSDYDNPAQPEPVAPQPMQASPVVVVYPPRQEVRPAIIPVRPEPPDTAAAAESDTPHYLIAFKDHTIYSAVAYWFDGDTLHYFTSGNTHNQATVSLIDRELTERLNREMGFDFKMPR